MTDSGDKTMSEEARQATIPTVDDRPVVKRLRDRFGDNVVETHKRRGDVTCVVDPSVNVDVLVFLRDDDACDFNFLVDICGVDYHPRAPRFEVVYHLLSMRRRDRIRIRCRLLEARATIASITPEFPAADWAEREAWDMFGIVFEGHPNLRRIMLYDEFEGHPLRKDYPINKRQPLIDERPIKDAWTPQR